MEIASNNIKTIAVSPSANNGLIKSVYAVQKRETISYIAQKFGISSDQLLEANPDIKNPNKIKIGQKINIPNIQSVDTTVNKTCEPVIVRAPKPGDKLETEINTITTKADTSLSFVNKNIKSPISYANKVLSASATVIKDYSADVGLTIDHVPVAITAHAITRVCDAVTVVAAGVNVVSIATDESKSKKDKITESSELIGKTAGSLIVSKLAAKAGCAVGIKIGLAIGTAIAPGPGTAIGAFVGGTVGAIAGYMAGNYAGGKIRRINGERGRRNNRRAIAFSSIRISCNDKFHNYSL